MSDGRENRIMPHRLRQRMARPDSAALPHDLR